MDGCKFLIPRYCFSDCESPRSRNNMNLERAPGTRAQSSLALYTLCQHGSAFNNSSGLFYVDSLGQSLYSNILVLRLPFGVGEDFLTLQLLSNLYLSEFACLSIGSVKKTPLRCYARVRINLVLLAKIFTCCKPFVRLVCLRLNVSYVA